MRAFVFLAKFIVAKYLKQEVTDNLSICLDKCSPCGLSVTRDIKIFQYHMICQSHIEYEVMTSVPPEAGYPLENFE